MARAFVAEPQSIGSRRSGLPVQYVIQAPNLDKLKEILPAFLEKAIRILHSNLWMWT
jgi:multidrug efflux pump